jgi:hypothetical protein
MNRVAIWVAQTAVGATARMVPAQATASPLPAIAAAARLGRDIAAPPIAMDVMPGLEGRARDALIQRGRFASASNALTVHPVTRRMIPGFMTPEFRHAGRCKAAKQPRSGDRARYCSDVFGAGTPASRPNG